MVKSKLMREGRPHGKDDRDVIEKTSDHEQKNRSNDIGAVGFVAIDPRTNQSPKEQRQRKRYQLAKRNSVCPVRPLDRFDLRFLDIELGRPLVAPEGEHRADLPVVERLPMEDAVVLDRTIAQIPQLFGPGLESEFFFQLAKGRSDPVVAGGDVSGARNVPTTRKRVLVRRAFLHENLHLSKRPEPHKPYVRCPVPDAVPMCRLSVDGLSGRQPLFVHDVQQFAHRKRT